MRAECLGEAGTGLDAEVRDREQGPCAEVPGTDEARKGAKGVLGPLIDAAFKRPDLDAEVDDGGNRQEQ